MALLIALAVALTPPASAVAVDPNGRLQDPQKEALAREIMADIRCLVCQNQSIEDSNADLARDLRQVVRERIAAGDSPDQVKRYLVDRYGDWVLMRPPVDRRTYLLWGGPGILLILGGALALANSRRKRAVAGRLSAEEEARVQSLLDEVNNP
ncbi:cytochrome C biogenesis protein [Rhodothalassium salexigens]|nr:cytochrome c-type biogenesis protein [Rhodothalassium salexigens]MBK5910455.1 cytochrome C biogenesis protein [Rhodothalassium salexigens]MBK5921727.1 cytochrome C biogenesis protein [Rhodothalassium salexigens]